MGIVLGTLAGVGAAISTWAVSTALDIGLLAPIFGAPIVELGALYSAEAGVFFSTLPVVTYEVIGVTVTTAGQTALGLLGTAAVGGIIGGSVAGAISNNTDALNSGQDITLEPSLDDYLNNTRAFSILDILNNDDDMRFTMRDDRVQKVRVVSRKKRQPSVQSVEEESVSEELEQQLQSGQSGPAKTRKVARKTRRLRKKSVKR